MKNTLLATLLGLLALPLAALSQTNADLSAAATAAATSPPPVVTDTNAPMASTATAATAPSAPASSIPLIQFQDVPLTTAIENLARQAGINYLLDPKIGYGQVDQNGQVKAEPTLSIRWENITAEHALLALLDNYNLQLVGDKNTQIARITMKDPTAPPPLITRVIQLQYASSSNMVDNVQAALTDKRSKVLADNRTSQLVVVATDPEQTSVDTLIAQLDRPTRQVLIEAKFVEITSTPETKKGINWTATLAGQNISYGNGTLNTLSANTVTATSIPGTPTTTPSGIPGHPGSTTTPGSSSATTLSTIPGSGFALNTASGLTPNIGFLNADGLHAVLSFLNSSADAQVVSTPRIVTLDNEMANLAVTRGYPIFNVSAGSANASGGSSVTYSNIGTTISVTPRISANGDIWLKVVPVISTFFGNFSQSVNGGVGASGQPTSLILTAPQFDSRSFITQVRIPNANTLVMGGLVDDSPSSQTTKVPIMGDIPLLGNLFRSSDKTVNKDNLLIFITPTIVQDSDFQPNHSDFLKSTADAKMPGMINPNSAWDNTKPYLNDKFQKADTSSQ